MQWRDRIKRFCRVKAADLRKNPHAWKIHPDSQRTALLAALAEIGLADAVIARELPGGTLELIDGHLRAEVLADPKQKVPVLVLDVNSRESKKLLATLDPLAAMAERDEAGFAALADELDFDEAALAAMVADLAGADLDVELAEEQVPLPAATARTKRGDLYQLGDHRLLCGDSASAANVNRLLGGVKIDLVNMDPPWNVDVQPRSEKAPRRRLPKDRTIENDCLPAADYLKTLSVWFGNAARALAPGRSFYIWGGFANCGNYPAALADSALYFSQAIIWVKQHPVLTRKDFMGNHEWCFYGWKEGAAHRFFGPANVPDVWDVKKINPRAMVHLTEKPVELAALAIGYSSRRGENVLDLFGGSGSTLIAAEQLGRRALVMEIDPLYCDVIVDRWEKLTSRRAPRH